MHIIIKSIFRVCLKFNVEKNNRKTTYGMGHFWICIDGLILCFEVSLVKAGIEIHLIKEEWSEWNEYGKRILYRIDIASTGGNRGAGQ